VAHHSRKLVTSILSIGERKARQQKEKKIPPLTADWREGIRDPIKRDPCIVAASLVKRSTVPVARKILPDHINATVGLPKLTAGTKFHVKTLHHTFGPKGHPRAKNLFEIIAHLRCALRSSPGAARWPCHEAPAKTRRVGAKS